MSDLLIIATVWGVGTIVLAGYMIWRLGDDYYSVPLLWFLCAVWPFSLSAFAVGEVIRLFAGEHHA